MRDAHQSPARASRQDTLVALISVLLISIAVLGVSFSQNINQRHTRTALPARCIGDKATDFNCLRNYYIAITKSQGPAAAFADLKTAYRDSTTVSSNCHPLTHAIGRSAAESHPRVADAYKYGDNFCWSGYYHGVMEQILKDMGAEKALKQADSICAGLASESRYSFFHYNCVHGLGHGYMILQNNKVFDSLADCDNLTDDWERQSCYGGAFMENINGATNPDHPTVALRSDQPLYPCTEVNQKYKQQCYLMQTSYALQVSSYDFAKVFALCDGIDTQFRDTCYQSLGRDASGNSVSNIEQTKASCLLGRDYAAQSNCIVGAVKDFISYHHSDVQGKQLCDSLPAELKAVCSSTATEYYKSF